MQVLDLKGDPLKIVREVHRRFPQGIGVSFSGGKDSVAMLDLCIEHWGRDKVRAFYLYKLPGLRVVNDSLKFYERQFGIPIRQYPSTSLCLNIKRGIMAFPSNRRQNFRVPTEEELYAKVRRDGGFEWIAIGEKTIDAPARFFSLGQCQGIRDEKKFFFPVAIWTNKKVKAYIAARGRTLSPDNYIFGRSFELTRPEYFVVLKENYPDDWEKVKTLFPHVEGRVVAARREREAKAKAAEERRRAKAQSVRKVEAGPDVAEPDQQSAV